MGDQLVEEGMDKKIKFAIELKTGERCISAGEKRLPSKSVAGFGIEAYFLNLLKGQANILQIYSLAHYMGRLKNSENHSVLDVKRRLTAEYCNTSDLVGFIEIKDHLRNEKKAIFESVIKVVADLHRRKLIHCDLKPQNIFLNRNVMGELRVVLGDLGHMVDMAVPRETPPVTGTDTYWSPEYAHYFLKFLENGRDDPILPAAVNTPMRDAWALGLTLLWHMERTPPPFHMYTTYKAVAQHLAQLPDGWLAEPTDLLSPQHLIWELLRVDPAKRLTVEQAEARLSSLKWSRMKKLRLAPKGGDEKNKKRKILETP